jgi:hypothetical protein
MLVEGGDCYIITKLHITVMSDKRQEELDYVLGDSPYRDAFGEYFPEEAVFARGLEGWWGISRVEGGLRTEHVLQRVHVQARWVRGSVAC